MLKPYYIIKLIVCSLDVLAVLHVFASMYLIVLIPTKHFKISCFVCTAFPHFLATFK